MLSDFQGKVILITGASSGIGRAAAQLLAAQGAKVALAARSKEALDELSATLPGSLVVPTDVRNEADVARMVQQTHAHYGRIDALVNNAGRGMHVPVAEASLSQYRELLELNVVSVLNAMQQVLPVMRAQGGGSIVNVSSGTTKMLMPGLAPYSSSKHALNNLTLIARAEFAPYDITVSLVHPGMTNTDFGRNAFQGGAEKGARYVQGDSAEYAARLIVRALQTGEAEVLAESIRQRLG